MIATIAIVHDHTILCTLMKMVRLHPFISNGMMLSAGIGG
jgi:hypothetical protein